MSTTETEIIQAIAEQLGLTPDDVDKNSLLYDDLNLGPIELNDLLSKLSQKFNISFEPDQIEHLSKVEDLVLLVEDNLLD